MQSTDAPVQPHLAAIHGHCAAIHRLSPPVLMQTQEDRCSLRFPAAVYLRNDAIRRHLAALFTDADCVSMEAVGGGILCTFRVRDATDG